MKKSVGASRNTAVLNFLDAIAGVRKCDVGDEREKEVVLRGNAVALSLGVVLQLILACALALTGLWTIGFIVVILAGLQGWVSILYAAVSGVNTAALAQRGGLRRRAFSFVLFIVVTVVFLGARIYQLRVGHAVFQIDSVAPVSTDSDEGWGIVVGAVCGVIIVLVGFAVAAKREAARNASQIDDED